MSRCPEPDRIEVVDEVMIPFLRAKSPSQRLDMIWRMVRFARQLAEAGIRHAHPDWTEDQVTAERIRRFAHGGT